MDNIYICSYGGIGNRLKNIVSGMILSHTTNKPLYVYCPINDHCGCHFEDLFEYPVLNFVSRNTFEEPSIPRYLDAKFISSDMYLIAKWHI